MIAVGLTVIEVPQVSYLALSDWLVQFHTMSQYSLSVLEQQVWIEPANWRAQKKYKII